MNKLMYKIIRILIEFTVEDDIRLKEVQPNMIVFEQHISEFEVMGIKL